MPKIPLSKHQRAQRYLRRKAPLKRDGEGAKNDRSGGDVPSGWKKPYPRLTDAVEAAPESTLALKYLSRIPDAKKAYDERRIFLAARDLLDRGKLARTPVEWTPRERVLYSELPEGDAVNHQYLEEQIAKRTMVIDRHLKSPTSSK